MRRLWGWIFRSVGVLAVCGVVAAALAVAVVGGLMSVQDEPRPADAIVVLGGQYFRPVFAAELYARGLAPEVWVVRPKPSPETQLLAEAGVDMPPQEEIYRRLLMLRGVPDSAIHLYGHDVQSTAEEAATLAAALGEPQDATPRTMLLVTSPYHVLRARMIFQAAMPRATILATATPYEVFPSPWWSQQQSAVRVVNETAKLTWYLLGGRFLSNDAKPRP